MMVAMGSDDKKRLTIEQLKNGFVVSICGGEHKGGMMGMKHDEWVFKSLPTTEEISAMFAGKYKGQTVEKPEERKKKIDDVADEYMEKTGEEYEDEEEKEED